MLENVLYYCTVEPPKVIGEYEQFIEWYKNASEEEKGAQVKVTISLPDRDVTERQYISQWGKNITIIVIGRRNNVEEGFYKLNYEIQLKEIKKYSLLKEHNTLCRKQMLEELEEIGKLIDALKPDVALVSPTTQKFINEKLADLEYTYARYNSDYKKGKTHFSPVGED